MSIHHTHTPGLIAGGAAMRREGRMHGWVYARERLVDPTMDPAAAAKRRLVREVVTEHTANGGLVRVSRKPTNHSKFTGSSDPCQQAYSKRRTSKGSNKFKHDEAKMYYLDREEDDDDV
ncbi:hypothetical protein GUJ93_ZPchr0007g3516 [Zizania palustris]|uniref:Uncharacterized protein n=1 Tax=Zizania palustris TaxID=103762 RepID=A0A8J5TCC7_ZIZPA|nr:hypothetical protein GUJ93_ZPchr0007g3516 [Zizania palustris]